MAPELHLSPDRLYTHAATAAVLADDLHSAGTRAGAAWPEIDRLRAAVRRSAAELAELGSVLAAAARAAEHGDRAALDALVPLLRAAGPGPR